MSAALNVSDRELLELAAKAAGWTVGFITSVLIPDVIIAATVDTGSKIFGPWDPRGDDGDALRLAATIGLTIAMGNGSAGDIVEVYMNSSLFGTSADGCAEKYGDDKMAAVRLAIFRAAVKIGRIMP